MTNTPVLVAGEPARDLALVFAQSERTPLPNGGLDIKLKLDPILGSTFMRALIRVEAELLTKEADSIGTPGFELRSNEQLRYDALLELIQRVGATMRALNGR